MKDTDLSRLRDGEQAMVTGIQEEGAMGRRLRDMGLVRGTPVQRLFESPFGDPAAYLVRGAVVALRRTDSRRVRVRLP